MRSAPRDDGDGGRMGRIGRGGGLVVDMWAKDGFGAALTGLRRLRTVAVEPIALSEFFQASMLDDDSNAPS